MYCENCGTLLEDGAKFCPNCGTPCASTPAVAKQELAQASAPAPKNEPTTSVQLFPDGKYRWTYDLNLLKNLSVFIDLIKVFGFIFLGIWLITVLGGIKRGFKLDVFMTDTKIIFLIFVFMLFLCLISYLIVVRINGGYYHLMFIMDEEGITHRQMASTAKKGRRIAAAAVIMDINNAPAATAAIQSEWTARYPKVRHVKTARRRHLIKVNEILTRNRIYVDNPDDYEFVLRYITEHCPNAKKKK